MFELAAPYSPAGDQPQAIAKLVAGLRADKQQQVMLGVTGSGKTFTVANIIVQVDRPTLVISHNKTLAAQLYAEFKSFFPRNAVEYFVSYFDYYQPEAYIPRTDTFIEKDSSVNEEIERMRLSTMSSLLSRRDVVVVASVSCIYGIGSKEDYEALMLPVRRGMALSRNQLLARLVDLQYTRNDIAFERSQFRVRGDTVEVRPAPTEDGLRLEIWHFVAYLNIRRNRLHFGYALHLCLKIRVGRSQHGHPDFWHCIGDCAALLGYGLLQIGGQFVALPQEQIAARRLLRAGCGRKQGEDQHDSDQPQYTLHG